MNKPLFRYTLYIHYNDQRLRLLTVALITCITILNALISKTIASSYSGETIERVSYSYLYSFSGRIGYIIPLILSAYITTSSIKSGQIIRVHLIGGSKDRAFQSLFFAATLCGGLVGDITTITTQYQQVCYTSPINRLRYSHQIKWALHYAYCCYSGLGLY